MTPPAFGGELARVAGYACASCGQQIISSIPVERCEACRARATAAQDARATGAPVQLPGVLEVFGATLAPDVPGQLELG
jgi:hypothetical protein